MECPDSCSSPQEQHSLTASDLIYQNGWDHRLTLVKKRHRCIADNNYTQAIVERTNSHSKNRVEAHNMRNAYNLKLPTFF
jgi:hypothetical protein